MLKKIFITLLVFIFFIQFSYAEDCNIMNWPSKDILEYLSNNKQILANITKELTTKSPSVRVDNIKQIKNTFWDVFNYNEILDWKWYMDHLDYYIIFPLSNDVTYQTKRDYSILENEYDSLNNYLKTIIKKWYNKVTIETACKEIDKKFKCNLSWSAWDILGILIKNHSNLIDNFKSAVIGWDNFNELILVNENFNENIKKDYWKTSWCASIEWSFFNEIKENISIIRELNEQWKRWLKDWDEAWSLLVWKTDDRKIEKELLIKELDRQWISWSKADAMINNLEKFNTPWVGFSWIWENNFVVNSAKYFWEWIVNQIENFNTDVFQEFIGVVKMVGNAVESVSDTVEIAVESVSDTVKDTIEYITWNQNNNISENNSKNNQQIATEKLLNNKSWINIDLEIATSVNEVYSKEIPFMYVWNSQTEQIRSDLINLHNNLSNSIKILNETCEVSVKVCKSQDSLLWNCWSCN